MYQTRSISTRTWLAAGIGLAAVALLTALIAFALSPSPDTTPTADAPGGSPTASAPPSAPALTGTPPSSSQSGTSGSGGSGTSGGDSGSGGGGGGATSEPSPAPTGAPPSLSRPDVVTYTESGAPVADAYGHAYDVDGPDLSLRVAKVEIEWGDGTTSTAMLTDGGAFRGHHAYDPSYAGRSVTVRMVAFGHDGQTTAESVTVTLTGL